jgi:hypothetical protein
MNEEIDNSIINPTSIYDGAISSIPKFFDLISCIYPPASHFICHGLSQWYEYERQI